MQPKLQLLILKMSLILDTVSRQRPLNFHERTELILSPEENILNTELQTFHDFTVSNKLVINGKKCYVMKFCRYRNYDFPAEMTIGGSKILEVKTKHHILGIIVQDDLRWQSQCEEMVSRATRCTWAIRRMRAMGVPQHSLVQ